ARVEANCVVLDALREQWLDYAAVLFISLGMVHGRTERQRVLDHAYRLLRPGGRLVLHVHNRWFNFWNPQGRRWLVRNLLESFVRRTGSGDRLMPMHQGISGLSLHLFTRREAERVLKRAGFRLLAVHPLSLRPDGVLPWAGVSGWP